MEHAEALAELKAAGYRIRHAQRNLDEAKEAARQLVQSVSEAKVYEQVMADPLGVDRMTVRRWLGKRGSRDHRAKQ